jgi:hypothetical protein
VLIILAIGAIFLPAAIFPCRSNTGAKIHCSAPLSDRRFLFTNTLCPLDVDVLRSCWLSFNHGQKKHGSVKTIPKPCGALFNMTEGTPANGPGPSSLFETTIVVLLANGGTDPLVDSFEDRTRRRPAGTASSSPGWRRS